MDYLNYFLKSYKNAFRGIVCTILLYLYLEKRPNVFFFFGHKREYTNLPSTWKLCAQHCKSRLIGVDPKKKLTQKINLMSAKNVGYYYWSYVTIV